MNSQLLVNDDLYESKSYEEGSLTISQDDVLTGGERAPFLVKILNGPHEGAEMEIPNEGITLGSGDACDLIVFDLKMAPSHFRLFPHEEGVILSPLEGEVFLGGVLVKEDTVIKSAAQVITAGDTYFVAGATNQEWPEVIFPTETSLSAEASSAQDVTLGYLKAKKKKKGIFVTLLLWGAVFVLGGGVGFWHLSQKNNLDAAHYPYLFSTVQKVKNASHLVEQYLPKKFPSLPSSVSSVSVSKKSSLSQIPAPLEVKIAQELLKKVPGVVFSYHFEGGKKQFDVWTRGEQSTTAVRRILGPVSPPLLYNLIDLAQVEASGMTLAQLFGISVQVHVEPEGIAFWKGYQKDEANWKVFFSHAIRELPAIRDHRCEIIFGTRVASSLNKELKQQGFSSDARFVADDNGLHTEGSVPVPQKPKWDLWIQHVHKMYASQVSIVDRVNTAHPEEQVEQKVSLKDLFPSPVVGISGTTEPWVSLADGSKFFPGAKLKEGYILESITTRALRVKAPEGVREFALP